MKESYSKRFNVLIHGLPEDDINPWEKYETTSNRFRNFLKKGLKIDNPMEIPIADIHRLPQRPIYVNGKRKCRPIIVKLTCAMDKSKIFRSAKNLKDYNTNRASSSSDDDNLTRPKNLPAYITDHLPKEFLAQKRARIPKFLAAKRTGSKTSWRIEDGCYNLYVDGIKAELIEY